MNINTNEKLSLYNQLVDEVNHCPNIEKCSSKTKMMLCEGCNEVNLWTYWEGGRDRLNAGILLVGQDWENCQIRTLPMKFLLKQLTQKA